MEIESLLKKEDTEKERIVEIKTIEFDWVFSTDYAGHFMKSIAECSNMELFQLLIVKAIILFLWKFYRRVIIRFVIIPYFVYFVVFLIYSTTTFEDKQDALQNGEYEGLSGRGRSNVIIEGLIIIFVAYFFILEVIQMVGKRLDFWKSIWSYLEIASLALNFSVVILDIIEERAENIRVVMVFAALLMWLKLFYLLRVFFTTAFLVRMITEIVRDMKWFVFLFLLSVGAFANTFYILSFNSGEGHFVEKNFFIALAQSYKMGLGEFEIEDFSTTEYLLWFMATLVMLIVMLNMLIAIMGDTFERVQESSESSMLKEVSTMM